LSKINKDPSPHIFSGEVNEDFRLFDPVARTEFNKQPMEKKKKSLDAKSFILYPFELIFNQKKSFEEKEAETLHLIEEHLKHHKKCFVSTSYGMDSIVLMHLVIKACKTVGCELPEFFLNDTLNTYKEEPEYWKLINEKFGIEDKFRKFKPPVDEKGNRYTVWSIAKKWGYLPNFRKTQRDGNNKIRVLNKGDDGGIPKCCEILKKKSMKELLKGLPKDQRYDCHFVGTRAEESRMRAMGVLQRCRSYVIKTRFPYQIRAVTPLSFWTKADIYEYYARYDIPKNPTYAIHNIDRMGCASCPAHRFWEVRLASDPTSEGQGMLKMNLKILKSTQPERYAESISLLKKRKLVPELITELENTEQITDYFGDKK
jgi:3'-phosphoadenosine 5'-phosphosulfate sulfotransferase (PAPS reductase)/FAD synthetase